MRRRPRGGHAMQFKDADCEHYSHLNAASTKVHSVSGVGDVMRASPREKE